MDVLVHSFAGFLGCAEFSGARCARLGDLVFDEGDVASELAVRFGGVGLGEEITEVARARLLSPLSQGGFVVDEVHSV